MSKSAKTQRLREKMRDAVKQSKQMTFDNLPEADKKESVETVVPKQEKQIVIGEIGTVAKEDELELKVGFRLFPSRNSFSKITVELYFDEQKIHTKSISIQKSPLARDELELPPFVLDMRGIAAGSHAIKVEMYELWSSGEKLNCTAKETTIEYVPVRRDDRLIKVPIVKSVAGADLTVVTDSEKDIYREIDESMRNEEASKRDEW
jgi:hypothetical protein